MSSMYAFSYGRPEFNAGGRLVVRRGPVRNGDSEYQSGEEMPRLDLTDRQIALLWNQGWIDTLPTTQTTSASAQPQKSRR